MKLRYLISILLLTTLASCSNQENPRFKVKPSALGVMNEIVVISDDDIWSSIVGDTVRHYFEGVYPLTPRPEPIFDLRQYEVAEINFQPLKKELRTYLILANLADTESEATQFVSRDLGEERIARAKSDPTFNTSVGKDKWANGQILIYLFAYGTDALATAVEQHFNGISSRINEHDAVQLYQSTYAKGHNRGLTSRLVERFGAEIDLPFDFQLVLDKEDENGLIWVRKEMKEGVANIAIREYDYTSTDLISKQAAKERFDAFGTHVSSKRENTFIVINDRDLPILEFDRTISNRYAKEWRGIWEMENDFMGGPFMSYAVVNETTGKLLVVDSFIFAPGKKKRNAMQQLDLIVKSLKW